MEARSCFERGKKVMFPGPGTPANIRVPLRRIRSVVHRGPSIVIVISRTCISFNDRSTLPLVRGCSGLLIMRAFSGSHSVTKVEVNFTYKGRGLVEFLGSIGCSFGSCAVSHATVTTNITTIRSGTCFSRAYGGVVRAER